MMLTHMLLDLFWRQNLDLSPSISVPPLCEVWIMKIALQLLGFAPEFVNTG